MPQPRTYGDRPSESPQPVTRFKSGPPGDGAEELETRNWTGDAKTKAQSMPNATRVAERQRAIALETDATRLRNGVDLPTNSPLGTDATQLSEAGMKRGELDSLASSPSLAVLAGLSESQSLDSVAEMAGFGEQSSPVERKNVGRYVTLGVLGAGGMGTVLAAYDPKLDRKVALKLLHTRTRDDSEHRVRMEREAQAMAKLSHPHVVTVYEVGEYDGQMFLAMEFIKGKDLHQWLLERNPTASWRPTLEMFLQAGDGLAAAHAAGLVHRDFKPGNVFVGDDGRARVGDFGLARQNTDSSKQDAVPTGLESLYPSALTLDLTRAGATMGTPAYMAPEQFNGLDTDARTDQFAFSVALWEALFGALPFAGKTYPELRHNVLTGQRAPTPSHPSVPTWLRRVLERGLSNQPADRYPTTEAFLAALRADPTPRRRKLMGVFAAGLVVAGVVAAHHTIEARQVAACEAAGASISQVWNAEVQRALRDSLLATDLFYASSTADRVLPYLTAQADSWKQARTQVCLNTRVEQTWSDDTFDRSLWCLDERRAELEAQVRELSRAKAHSIQKAISVAAKLLPIEPCLDRGRLEALPPPPPDRRLADTVVELLQDAQAKLAAGAFDEGLGVAEQALEKAQALGWPPLVASARKVKGLALVEAAKHTEAVVELESAYFLAADAGAWRVAAAAARVLAEELGAVQAQFAEGLRWVRHANIALSFLGEDDDSLSHANILAAKGIILGSAGKYAEAREPLLQALAIKERILGPNHLELSRALSNLAVSNRRAGYLEASRTLLQRLLLLNEASLGPDHPAVAGTLNNLGNVTADLGAYEEALALYRRGLAIREAALPPDHTKLALSLANVAEVLGILGDYEQASTLNRRALSIYTKAMGPEHPIVAALTANLAGVYRHQGQYEEAEELFQRSLAVTKKVLGPDHANVAGVLMELATLHNLMHADGQARVEAEESVRLQEKVYGSDHVNVALALTIVARIAVDEGRVREALASAERAVNIQEVKGVPAEKLAASRYELARALMLAPEADTARAATLARQVEEAYRGKKGNKKQHVAVEAFIKTHFNAG